MTESAVAKTLTARKLQIDSLLALTRAINGNTKERDLYELYELFLRNQLSVDKVVLYYHKDIWECVCSYGTSKDPSTSLIHEQLVYFKKLKNLKEEPVLGFEEFDYVIPVFHKEQPLAFALLSTIRPDDFGTREEKLDFIETLTNIIISAIENKRLFKRQLTQEGLKKELELAGKMQSMLIPSKLPSNSRIEMSAVYLPHNEIGGDYYDYIALHDNKISFCIADVSGKGIAAALLMSNFQANLRTLATQNLTMEKLITALNTRMCEITREENYITLFYAKYNLQSKKLLYVNAGHVPPLLCNSRGITPLTEGTTLIGMFDPLPHITVAEMYIEEESLLMLFTDGLTELENERHEYFGEKELERFLQLYHSLPPEQFNQKIMEKINDYKGYRQFSDDISLLTCKLF